MTAATSHIVGFRVSGKTSLLTNRLDDLRRLIAAALDLDFREVAATVNKGALFIILNLRDPEHPDQFVEWALEGINLVLGGRHKSLCATHIRF
jgi:hypothetical protein